MLYFLPSTVVLFTHNVVALSPCKLKTFTSCISKNIKSTSERLCISYLCLLGSLGRRANPVWQARLFLLPHPHFDILPSAADLQQFASHGLGKRQIAIQNEIRQFFTITSFIQSFFSRFHLYYPVMFICIVSAEHHCITLQIMVLNRTFIPMMREVFFIVCLVIGRQIGQDIVISVVCVSFIKAVSKRIK